MHFTAAELTAWLNGFLWPFFRIGAMFMVAPVFGAQMVPVRIRVALATLTALVVAPVLGPMPQVEALGPAAVLIVAQQLLVGLLMGFVLHLVFSAIIAGGQVLAMQMGLGFASMVDPQNGLQIPLVSQFYLMFGTLVFLALNGHLVLIQVLVHSFETLPPGASLLPESLWQLALWGGQIFAGAVSVAIPAIASLLVVNLAFAVVTRAAPQFNIFAVGFPITLLLGFVLILLTLGGVVPQINALVTDGFVLMGTLSAEGR